MKVLRAEAGKAPARGADAVAAMKVRLLMSTTLAAATIVVTAVGQTSTEDPPAAGKRSRTRGG
ncbi:hypothetical protein GCM10027269_75680 [Kribbella endophytica]